MYSIVIPTMKSEDEIKELIKEVNESTTGKFELIVTGQKVSAAKNRNIGLEKASGEIIIMIDDDMKDFPHGWNEVLVEPLIDGKAVMVAARLLAPDGSLGMTMAGNYDTSDEYVESYNKKLPTACIAFKKNNLRFDEAYVGSGFEDTDFCQQMEDEFPTGKFLINNNVRIIHINEMKNQQGPNWVRNEKYYMDKWTGKRKQDVLESKNHKLSVCWIIKNEEEYIERSIRSAYEIADELIVVDTGSTDRTLNIVKSMGIEPKYFEWCDDFAKARNFAISQATSEWVLFLDADEVISRGDKVKVKEMMSIPTSQNVLYLTKIESVMDGGQHVANYMARMFLRDGRVEYEGRIHERIKPIKDKDILVPIKTDDLVIEHYGYATSVMKERNKFERNATYLLKEAEEHPGDPFYMYHLGLTYRVSDKIDEAIGWFEKWHEMVRTKPIGSDHGMGYAAFLGCLIMKGEFEKAAKIGEGVWEFCKPNPDFNLNFAVVLQACHRYDDAIQVLEFNMNLARTNGVDALAYDMASLGWKSMGILGNCYMNKGLPMKAIEIWEKAKQINYNQEVLRGLYIAYIQIGKFGIAERYARELIEKWPEERTDEWKLNVGNMLFNTGKIKEGLKLMSEMAQGKGVIADFLAKLLQSKKFSEAKVVDQFMQEEYAS